MVYTASVNNAVTSGDLVVTLSRRHDHESGGRSGANSVPVTVTRGDDAKSEDRGDGEGEHRKRSTAGSNLKR